MSEWLRIFSPASLLPFCPFLLNKPSIFCFAFQDSEHYVCLFHEMMTGPGLKLQLQSDSKMVEAPAGTQAAGLGHHPCLQNFRTRNELLSKLLKLHTLQYDANFFTNSWQLKPFCFEISQSIASSFQTFNWLFIQLLLNGHTWCLRRLQYGK